MFLTVEFAVRLTLTALLFYGKNKINVKIAGKMWEHSKHCKKKSHIFGLGTCLQDEKYTSTSPNKAMDFLPMF